MEASYGFIIRDGLGDLIFLHISNVSPCLWKALGGGDQVEFSLAFTFRGASAFDVQSTGRALATGGQLNLLWSKDDNSSEGTR